MTRDTIILAAVVLAFGSFVTAHLCIVAGLSRRSPRWHSVAAFFLVPLAPYWAVQGRMYIRGVAWIAAALMYAVALGLARAT